MLVAFGQDSDSVMLAGHKIFEIVYYDFIFLIKMRYLSITPI